MEKKKLPFAGKTKTKPLGSKGRMTRPQVRKAASAGTPFAPRKKK